MPVILVVEDYEPNLLVAGALLNEMRFAIDGVSDGYAALEKIKAGGRYAAILMDLQMRGMDGVQTTQKIRAFEAANGLPSTPILGLTAHMLPSAKEDCIAAGMNDFMTKPYTTKDLKDRLDKLIGA